MGTPVGVVVVPTGFAPDGKARIVSLLYVDDSGNTSTSYKNMKWSNVSVDTELTNFTQAPTTDNAGSTSTGSAGFGNLPSDKFTGTTSYVDGKVKYVSTSIINMIPSPYLGEAPNPEYYKEILSSGINVNALSDFNGLSNTEALVGLGADYVAANAAYKYKDGTSNLQWYLPAMGELGYLISRLNAINNVIAALGGVTVNGSNTFWSSSENSSNHAYSLGFDDGGILNSFKFLNNYVRPFAILDDGEDSGGGSKTINYIRMSYEETGPDEYAVHLEADFIPASHIRFEMDRSASTLGGATVVSLQMVPGVPTLERLTYSPKEDDTYIYEVIMA